MRFACSALIVFSVTLGAGPLMVLADGMPTGENAVISSDSVDGEKTSQEKMEWFNEAKLGIFIHWGIYSVRGVAERWSFPKSAAAQFIQNSNS
jgi:hypothetical protein